jgi:hypothetical protein
VHNKELHGVNSVLGLSHHVAVGDGADISEVLAAIIFRVNPEYGRSMYP